MTQSLVASFAVIALAASTLACAEPVADDEGDDVGTSTSEQEIVGGVEARPGAWAGATALYYRGQQICGGTLVAPEWVLTAAHCIVSASAANGGIENVVIGRHRLSGSGGDSVTVKKAFRHAGYDSGTMDNDIALLQLTRRSTQPTAKVATSSQASQVVTNTSVTVVGWGRTAEGSSTSDVLREVSVPVISNRQCGSAPGYDVTNNMICAGVRSGGRDSCQGDSGGPLFLAVGGRPVQVGVVSWGIGCARPNAPGVYTRVGNYLSWLSTTSGGAIR